MSAASKPKSMVRVRVSFRVILVLGFLVLIDINTFFITFQFRRHASSGVQ